MRSLSHTHSLWPNPLALDQADPAVSGRWERKPHRGQSAGRVGSHLTPARFDQLLDQGEAESVTATRPISGFVDAVEAIEDARDLVGRNDGPRVGHADARDVSPEFCMHG